MLYLLYFQLLINIILIFNTKYLETFIALFLEFEKNSIIIDT